LQNINIDELVQILDLNNNSYYTESKVVLNELYIFKSASSYTSIADTKEIIDIQNKLNEYNDLIEIHVYDDKLVLRLKE